MNVAQTTELYLWIRFFNSLCIEIIEAQIDAKMATR